MLKKLGGTELIRGKRVRSFFVFLVVALVFVLLVPMTPGNVYGEGSRPFRFPDVPDNFWARNEILSMAEKGIVAGKPDGRFDPNSPVTRGQFALMLYRMLSLPPGEARFKDVPSGTRLAEAVGAIVEKGIAKGYPDGRFRPNEPITRGQMAVMLTRTLGLEELAIIHKNTPLPFTDRFVETQRGYIYVVSEYGLIRGGERNGKRVFRAGDTASRAETAVILYRTMAVMEEGVSRPDPENVRAKGYEIPQRVIGSLPSTEGMPYENPLRNESWVVWMGEKADLDPGLAKPSGHPEHLIRQAVLGWYDVRTKTAHTMPLPYVFVYWEKIPDWDSGSFEILPPVFGLDGDDVYVVHPDEPKVLYRINLKTRQRTELKLPQEVPHLSHSMYSGRPLVIQYGVLALQPDYDGSVPVHYFYDLASDTLFQFESRQDYHWKANRRWVVWSDTKREQLLVYDRNAKTLRRFDDVGSVFDRELVGDWLVYEASEPDSGSVHALHLETGRRQAVSLDGKSVRVLAGFPEEQKVLLEAVTPLGGSENVEAYEYDLQGERLIPFSDLGRLKRKQMLDLHCFADTDGHVYLVSREIGQFGHRIFLIDWDRRQLLGHYGFEDRNSNYYPVGIHQGELILLWHQRNEDRQLDKVKIINVPMELFKAK